MIPLGNACSRLFVAAIASAAIATTVMGQQPPPQAAPRAQIADDEIHVRNIENMRYPPSAHMGKAEGVVVVRAELNELGGVVAAAALSGHSALVADALANVKQWSFTPNKQRAVIVVYDFRIEGACNGLISHSALRSPNIMSVRGCTQMFQP